jgi:hypothetical protein
LSKVRGLVKKIIDTVLVIEEETGQPAIFIGVLGAEKLSDRPEAAILRAIKVHPAYRRKNREVDSPLEGAAAIADDRTRRALRIETSIMWKMASTPEEQASEFRFFRVLPTLANDDEGHARDPVLEPQLQMLKCVLYHSCSAVRI